MTKSNTKNVSYYKISNGQIVFSSSVTRRFFARFIDFLLAGIIGKLLLSIYTFINSQGIPTNPTSSQFSDYLLNMYDPILVTGWILMIFGYISILWLFPLFNKKYPGQTLGKKILKIAPMYLKNDNFKKYFFIRESFISLLIILCLILITSMGVDVTYVFIRYKHFILAFDDTYTTEIIESMGIPVVSNIWEFMGEVWTNSYFMGEATIDVARLTVSYIQKILMIIWFSSLLVIFLTIIFMPNKRGIHDIASSVAIINLRTIRTEQEFIHLHKPSFEITNYKYNLPAILKK